MTTTEVCPSIQEQSGRELFVELPQQICVDILAHCEKGLDKKIEECIRGLCLRQPISDFEERRYLCVSALLTRPYYSPLAARIAACASFHFNGEDKVKAYMFYFPSLVPFSYEEKLVRTVNVMDLVWKIADSPKLTANLRAYGIHLDRCSSLQEADAFFSCLIKRVQFLFDHQFSPIQEYFGSASQTTSSTQKLSEFFLIDECRNILVLHKILTTKCWVQEMFFLSSIFQNSKSSILKTFCSLADRCVGEWEAKGSVSSSGECSIIDLSSDVFVPETCILTKIPSKFLETMRIHKSKYVALSLAQHHLFSLPKIFGTLSLNALDISRNLFEEFPAWICEMKSLKYLFAQVNLFTFIPNEYADRLTTIQEGVFDEYVTGVPSMMMRSKVEQIKAAEASKLPGVFASFDVGKEELDEYKEHYLKKI